MDLIEFVRESNRIERILRDPHPHEIRAHEMFLANELLTVANVEELVSFLEPGARLRRRPGMDVRIGDHFPIPGGSRVESLLDSILSRINDKSLNPYEAHHEYETLHPFIDGNGRSGRAIWLWMHTRDGNQKEMLKLGFLHWWYYESLSVGR